MKSAVRIVIEMIKNNQLEEVMSNQDMFIEIEKSQHELSYLKGAEHRGAGKIDSEDYYAKTFLPELVKVLGDVDVSLLNKLEGLPHDNRLNKIMQALDIRSKASVDALFADGFDLAMIGTDTNGRAVYEIDKMVDILMERDKMSREDAMEYLDYNVFGAYMGNMTPVYIYLDSEMMK